MFLASDMTKIEVGEQKVAFIAPKSLVTASSTVFEAMLRPPFTEGRAGIMHLEDFSAATVGRFILWLHSGSVIERGTNDENSLEISTEDLSELYVFSDKYDITDLKHHIIHCLYSRFTKWVPPHLLEIYQKGASVHHEKVDHRSTLICVDTINYLWDHTSSSDPVRRLIKDSLCHLMAGWKCVVSRYGAEQPLLQSLPPELLAAAVIKLGQRAQEGTSQRDLGHIAFQVSCGYLGHGSCPLEGPEEPYAAW